MKKYWSNFTETWWKGDAWTKEKQFNWNIDFALADLQTRLLPWTEVSAPPLLQTVFCWCLHFGLKLLKTDIIKMQMINKSQIRTMSYKSSFVRNLSNLTISSELYTYKVTLSFCWQSVKVMLIQLYGNCVGYRWCCYHWIILRCVSPHLLRCTDFPVAYSKTNLQRF